MTMKKIFLFFSLLISLYSWTQKATSTGNKRLAGIEQELEVLLKDWRAAGFAVAIVEKDKIIYAKGFGYRGLGK